MDLSDTVLFGIEIGDRGAIKEESNDKEDEVQSMEGLVRQSQSNPRTAETALSSGVTRKRWRGEG